MNKFSVLIIDDEESQLQSLKSFLSKRIDKVYTAPDGKAGFKILENNLIDVIFTDLRMPEWDGMRLLREVKNLNPEVDVIVMTAFGSVEDAVTLMKEGAYDYLTKPIDLDELEQIINRVKEKRLLKSENRELKAQLQQKFKFDSIISQSSKMEEALNTAARVADSKATILICGESGTGKELVAKAIHYSSLRKDKPFITVNVAALSENLLESELFGHEKGSYTGATQQRIGRFEEANKGTLFIDEVGEIPLSVQVKLLRALQFGEIHRIGSNEDIKVDVRIITATNRNLNDMIKDNEFREDLFYRLNVVKINLPKLYQRKSDIPVLIDYFIEKYSKENNKNITGISKEAMDKLMKYDYPGNVRELENIIERAVVLARDNMLTSSDLPPQIESFSGKSILDPINFENSYDEKTKAFESEMITEALKSTNGNKSATARILKMTERHLRSRIERLGLKL
ncbi:sigma-54-dependent transcriptional regulator [Bacteroidota bacterium]